MEIETFDDSNGVYVLYNPVTAQAYIGSSADVFDRRKVHLQMLKAGKHPNKRLQNAFNKHPDFDFYVLRMKTRDEAFDQEQSLIDEFHKTGRLLNMSRNARYCLAEMTPERKAHLSRVLTGRKHTDEAKAKIGAASRGNKHRLGSKMSEPNKEALRKVLVGRAVSKETRAKIGKANKGRRHLPETNEANRLWHLGKKASDATREKMSIARKGKSVSESHLESIRAAKALIAKPVSINGVVYSGINEAARALMMNAGSIHYRLNNPRLPHWFYVESS